MINLIVAYCSNFGIGFKNGIPWSCARDMKRFSEITRGHIVIMGHNTWKSLNVIYLKNRINIVISRSDINDVVDIKSPDEGLFSFISLYDCLKSNLIKKYNRIKNIFIIGGESLYREVLEKNIVQNLYITQINGMYECDRFFDFDMSMAKRFELIERQHFSDCTFVTWRNQNFEEIAFMQLLKTVNDSNVIIVNRTAAAAKTIFNHQNLVFNLQHNVFPLATSRQSSLKLIFEELRMNLLGITDTKYLEDKNINIWKTNSSREFLDSLGLDFPAGVIGETYGHHIRNFAGRYEVDCAAAGGHYSGFDQLMYVINEIKTNPSSRRLIISLWNPASLENCALPPCACWYEFFVSGRELSMRLVQRSSDILVAGHHNITYASLLLILIAYVCDLTPHKFIWCPSNIHIYENNLEYVSDRVERKLHLYPLLFIRDGTSKNIENITFSDLMLFNYNFHIDKVRYVVN